MPQKVLMQLCKGWPQKKGLRRKYENRRICELCLRAWNGQQSIADVLGIPQQTISDNIDRT
ncbi:MAG: hypothetical protein JW705_00680 [Methanosarcinaceae archaeon]|nr:hypothetical protein [Methanosarcinaceae archaeon]